VPEAQLFRNEQVTRGGNRQEFRHPLDDAEKHDLQVMIEKVHRDELAGCSVLEIRIVQFSPWV
jgi:hypothetical protein